MGTGNDFRRWYPTATTLPNGTVLVLSGSYKPSKFADQIVVRFLQVWDNGAWKPIRMGNGDPLGFDGLPLYPRMHVISDGRVFMSGTNAQTFLLKTSEPGRWTKVADRAAGARDYAPAVMFAKDKIIYIGGGNNVPQNPFLEELRPPTDQVEVIDLGGNPPESGAWKPEPPMHFPRRHHNAVLLPDGTVLVIGGTRGGNGARPAGKATGFNDLGKGQPVHSAELWDPSGNNGDGEWQVLAAEEIDRGYHSTGVLLPDARVLSAGGGEYRPDDVHPNPADDTHLEAQIFSPRYLFRGRRPVITSAPVSVQYGQTFEVHVSSAEGIGKVSWIRLPSVTHAFDQNQRINCLDAITDSDPLKVTAPDKPEVCPPGHYMLFVLSDGGVPSEAAIVRIGATTQARPQAARAADAAMAAESSASP
jgi:hypothetical protein